MIEDAVAGKLLVRVPRRGEKLRAATLDAVAGVVNDIIRQAPDYGVRSSRSSAKLAADTVESGRFQITAIKGDYLIAIRYHLGNLIGSPLSIARPFMLRTSLASHNGISFSYSSVTERTADDGSETEDQVIVPAYVVDDFIMARRAVGGTGVIDDNAKQVDLYDENVDGRAWAKKAE